MLCEHCKRTRIEGKPCGDDITGYRLTLKGQSFITPYTNSEAMDILDAAIEDGRIYGDFAKDLRTQYMTRRRGGLSPKQWGWVHKIIHDRIDHADSPADAPREKLGDMSKIAKAFEVARKHKKNPRIRFEFEDGGQLVLNIAGSRARKPGSINVTDGGRYGDNKWYGRIHTDGTWEPARRSYDDAGKVLDFLKEFAKDPAGTAIAYGKASGRCCFCGRELKHGQLGYGPECAKKWGMPWTEKMAKDETVVPDVKLPGYDRPDPVAPLAVPTVEEPKVVAVLVKTVPAHWNPTADAYIPERVEAADLDHDVRAVGENEAEALMNLGAEMNKLGIKDKVEITRI